MRPLSTVRLLPPLRPGALYCAVANYRDDARASGRAGPELFVKAASTIVGPDEAIRVPAPGTRLDWGAELAVVIGRPCYRATLENARAFVAGYTIVNDLALSDERDRLGRSAFDTATPVGPSLTLADDVPDPHALTVRCWVNHQLHQDARTADLVHGVDALIVALSRRLTLQPGDVIATGTPAGRGGPRNLTLERGDVVTIEISGLGVLRNPVV